MASPSKRNSLVNPGWSAKRREAAQTVMFDLVLGQVVDPLERKPLVNPNAKGRPEDRPSRVRIPIQTRWEDTPDA